MSRLEELKELAGIIHSGIDAVIECIEQADYDTLDRLIFPPAGEESLFDFMCNFDELTSEGLDTFTDVTLDNFTTATSWVV